MEGLTVTFVDRPELSAEDESRILAMGTEDDAEEIAGMLESARAVARPGYAFRMSRVEKSGGAVLLDGQAFSDPLVVSRLSPLMRCFPCVQSCGAELEEWSLAYKDDPLTQYWADAVKRAYLGCASRAFTAYLRSFIPRATHIAALNPGSLKEWPITNQEPLFRLLGRDEVERRLGVKLTPSMLMLPSKSVSGIWFESSVSYENCMYCPRTDCPGRRAAYRPGESPV